MKKIKTIVGVILFMAAWTAFVWLGFVQGYLLQSINSRNTPQGFVEASKGILETEYVGNLALALVENWVVSETYFHTNDNHALLNEQSAFPVASISKWVTALGVLHLVQEGKLDLDRPVEAYLTRWHLPESEFDNAGVTVRRLLSHSAGFDDDLGYGGFTADETMQTLEESLDLAADRGDYGSGRAQVGYPPGDQFRYSGASYALLQLLIEEVSGQSFTEYMQATVFDPLGMTHSSFQVGDSTRIRLVDIYRTDSTRRPMVRLTAQAAGGLMTSVADLAQFFQAMSGAHPAVLSSTLIEEMGSPQSYRNGFAYYGLGPHLYTNRQGEVEIIGHDGSGNNAINTAARLNPETGDGIIVLETGHFYLASRLSDEWVFWKTSIADRVVMERNLPFIISLLIGGYLLIIGLAVWFGWKRKRG
ncbi:MAG TPA: serine hydrolase [Cytophagales bacterium]|nr:serine hydrolase [Cytophagales bacterium]HAP61003.1 serine hydrolase [Cytophagales bacterium]